MNWTRINLAVIVADVAGMAALHMRVKPSSLAVLAVPCALLCVLYVVYTRFRPDEKIGEAAAQVLGLTIFGHASALLSYLVVATNLPFSDAAFARIDTALGFDWLTWFHTVRAHPALHALLAFVYATSIAQIALVLLFLTFSVRQAEGRAFSSNLVISSLATIAISGIIPSVTAWRYYHVTAQVDMASLSDFFPLRMHQLPSIDLMQLQGLISMPSYHAVICVLLVYAVRSSKFMTALLLPLNALVLLSTLSEGGHYLCDVLGGILVAVAAIAITRALQRQHGAKIASAGDAASPLSFNPPHMHAVGVMPGNRDRMIEYTLD